MDPKITELRKDEFGIRVALYRGYLIERLGSSYDGRPTPEATCYRVSILTNPMDPGSVNELVGMEFDSINACCAWIDKEKGQG